MGKGYSTMRIILVFIQMPRICRGPLKKKEPSTVPTFRHLASPPLAATLRVRLKPLAFAVHAALAAPLVAGMATHVHAQALAADRAAPEKTQAALPAVTVRQSMADDAKSEDSRSYTTPSMGTATGLYLSIRDTPQSVSVVTRERMNDQAMVTVADALRNTIGLSVKPVDRGRNTLSARGFDINNFQFDGVPTTTGNIGIETVNTAMFDRIEVVRGATGLLSGAGDASAAVNLVRKHANSKVFAGQASVGLGSWNQRTGMLDLSTPLNADGSVRGRMVASMSRQDAFIDLENTENTLLYGVVDADLGARTRLSVGASHQKDKRNGVLWAGLPYWYADGTRTDWSRSKTTATRWNQWDTQEQTLFATLEHTLENRWKIRGNASYHKQTEDSKLLWMWGNPDRTTGLGMQAYPYHYVTKPEQANLDLVATGPLRLWGRDHELTFGLTHGTVKGAWTNRDAVAEGSSFPVGNFNNWDGSFAEPALGARYVGSQAKTTQTAAYAAARLQATDALKFIVGGRVSNWKREEGAGTWTAAPYVIKHENEFTPYVGVIYDLGEQVSAYGSYTSIFNPQTKRDQSGKYLDPLEGKSYEAGLKGEFLDGKLNASAAIFRTIQENFAVPDGVVVINPTETAFRTAKGVKVQGYELEASGEIARGWNIGVGWISFSARDASNVDVAVDHPRKQLKLFTKYALQGTLQGLSLGGGVNWEGKQPARATNPATGLEEDIGQKAYALVDLMAHYAINRQVSLQLNIHNAFNKKYVTRNTAWWGGPFVYGEPRKVLVTMNYKF